MTTATLPQIFTRAVVVNLHQARSSPPHIPLGIHRPFPANLELAYHQEFSSRRSSSILSKYDSIQRKVQMPKREFTVSQAYWPMHKPLLRAIRESVFIVEQRVPKELEWDDQDASALHVVATDSEANGVGTGRVTAVGQIGRMAVLPDWRAQGVGSAILTRLIALAKDQGRHSLFLNAQERAIPFYLRHGFHCVGETFMEAGIPHQRMEQDQTPLEDDQEAP